MSEIFVLIEHRQGVIRDISYELMACGRKLAQQRNSNLTAIILGYETEKFVERIKTQAHRLLIVDHEAFRDFNAELYQIALANIIKQEQPFITLIGHTAFGVDLGPALATQLNMPYATDCLAIDMTENELAVTRQMYNGKLHANVRLRKDSAYLLSVRPGCFPVEEGNLQAEVVSMPSLLTAAPDYRKFIEYIEAVTGDVDITKSDIVVGVGRGIKEQENLAMVEDFAKAIGGVVACTRPIIDAGWLPKDRQVGSSGKTIKPKLYIAFGISGAFQHIMGIKNADTIIVINKDANAPIFNEADYGIVDDLFKVLPALKEKILEMR